jgi:ABC-2 type transport system permease protein
VDLFLPSMLFMALFFMAFGISEDVWVEKQQGTLRRALATPNASAQFLAGKLLSAAAMMATVVFSALIAARFLLGAQIQNTVLAGLWATLAGALFLALLYVMQLYASSQRAGGILSSIVMLPLLMLGGSFFPFEVMPEALVRIGRLTPNGWALVELRTIIEDNVGWGRLGLSTAVVLLVGMILFAAANRRMAGVFARS